jgi:hypothetical protein
MDDNIGRDRNGDRVFPYFSFIGYPRGGGAEEEERRGIVTSTDPLYVQRS